MADVGIGSARDAVDHSCLAVGLNSILQVHKPLSAGLVGAETGADAQGVRAQCIDSNFQ